MNSIIRLDTFAMMIAIERWKGALGLMCYEISDTKRVGEVK
jgi:hypothetical protein